MESKKTNFTIQFAYISNIRTIKSFLKSACNRRDIGINLHKSLHKFA